MSRPLTHGSRYAVYGVAISSGVALIAWLAVAAPTADPKSSAHAGANAVSVGPPSSIPCGASRLSLSPDGARAVAFLAEDEGVGAVALGTASQAAIIDVDCIVHGRAIKDCSLGAVTSRQGFSQAYWSQDGRILFVLDRAADLHAVRVGPTTGAVPEIAGSAAIGPPLSRLSIQITGPGLNDVSREQARLRSAIAKADSLIAHQPDIRRARITLDGSDKLPVVVQRRRDLRVGFVSANRNVVWRDDWWPVYGGAPFLARDANEGVQLLGAGIVTALDPRTQQRVAAAYSKPILNAANGGLVGWHSELDAHLGAAIDAPEELRATLEASAAQGQAAIYQVGFAGRSRGAAVYKRLGGGGVYQFLWHTHSAWHAASFACSAPKAPAVERTILELGSGPSALPARLYSRPGARGIVFYAQGGPAESLAYEPNWPTIDRLLSEGFDVFAVDYSGSVGATRDVAMRLKHEGGPALEADANLALTEFRKRAAHYDSTTLYAESFGGTLALAMIARQPDAFDRVVLAAPWLQYRPNAEYFDRGDQRAAGDYQTLFEASHMGIPGSGPTALDRWLAHTVATTRLGANTLVLVGDQDNKSEAGDLPPHTGATLKVLKGAGHLSALTSNESWALARAWLGRDTRATRQAAH